MPVALCWFRRNLRLDDNVPLDAACRAADAVVPVFVLDDHYLTDDFSPPRLAVLRDSIVELDAALRARGSRLVVRNGPPATALAALAREVGAEQVFAHVDHEPYARRRDAEAARALASMGARLVLGDDLLLVPPDTLTTAAGKPFTVYTPFSRRWLERDKAVPIPEPPRIPTPPDVLAPGFPSIPLDRPRAFRESGAPENPRGGAVEARRLWDDFRGYALSRYGEERDLPARPGTSRLSPHLRFGTIGPRRLLAEARAVWLAAPPAGRSSVETFVKELAWREFYAGVLHHFPRVESESFRPEMDRFPWVGGEEGERRFAAWASGRTGYPIVDAGMRQLLREGWVHNRVRMIVASFLTKDLLVDWRRGEAYFRRYLADGDLASNVGGWQWAAGAGTDAQPFFRIFNPTLQGTRFDPDGVYVRRHVPELSRFSKAGGAIHEPWSLPSPPGDYPSPLVDHAVARRSALDAFAALRR